MISAIQIERMPATVRVTRSNHKEDVETEQKIAIRDLLAENSFQPVGANSDRQWSVNLALRSGVLILDYTDSVDQQNHQSVEVKLDEIKGLIRDYFAICERYFAALRDDPRGLETVDMARRGLHNEAGELLKDMLSDTIQVDLNTARRLFTILCTMHLAS